MYAKDQIVMAFPSPEEDCAALQQGVRKCLEPARLARLGAAAKPGSYRNVLLTGATGFVGRMTLHALLEHTKATIFCLTRDASQIDAMDRIQGGLEEARVWEDHYAKRIEIITGDLTLDNLGLETSVFSAMGRQIDAIYHCAQVSTYTTGYAGVRVANTMSLLCFLDLCTTTKLKHFFFLSALGRFPAFLVLFGKEYRHSFVSENSTTDVQELRQFAPPEYLGLPWTKWACEEALKVAFGLGLPGAIFRVPPLWVACTEFGFADSRSFATMVIGAACQEALFPIGVSTAPLTPADTVTRFLVQLSNKPKRRHNIYNLCNPEVTTSGQLIQWGQEIGFKWKGVPWSEFAEAVAKRGNDSPCASLMPFLGSLAEYWFDTWAEEVSSRKKPTLPVSTLHLQEDLPDAVWPPTRQAFSLGFIFLCQRKVFSPVTLTCDMSVDALFEEAKSQTGLSDVGDDPEYFLEGVRRLFDAAAQRPITFQAKVTMIRTFRQYFHNILFMTQMAKEFPEIEQQEVADPVFIVGLNRSGTTFLQYLMGQDSETRTTALCEMMMPYGSDGTYRPRHVKTDASWKNDPRADSARELCNQQLGLSRELMALHMRRANQPEEDFILFEHMGRSYSMCLGFQIKEYRDWLLEDNMKNVAKGYKFHRRFLQHLQFQRSAGKRWLLKMPFHLFALETLFETYPTAKIIFCHRDPVAVVTSWCKLEAVIQEAIAYSRDPHVTGRDGLDILSRMLENCIKFRKNHPELADRFVDVYYDELISHPIESVQQIYKQYGWKLQRSSVNRMWSYMLANRALRPLVQKEAEAAMRESERLHKQRLETEKQVMSLGTAPGTAGERTPVVGSAEESPAGASAEEEVVLSEEDDEEKENTGGVKNPWGNMMRDTDTASPLRKAGIDADMVKEAFRQYIDSAEGERFGYGKVFGRSRDSKRKGLKTAAWFGTARSFMMYRFTHRWK